MTRRERLTATLRGKPVDRPVVSFYEIGGWKLDPDNPDPFNIYNSPDWRQLIELAEDETDVIRLTGPEAKPTSANCRDDFLSTTTWQKDRSRFSRTTVNVAGRALSSQTRREQAISTTWTTEHLLKNADDARAYLELPDDVFASEYDVTPIFREERELGEAGIVMLDIADPLCVVAELFSMEDYTVIALTEPSLFHSLLDQASKRIYPMVEFVDSRLQENYGESSVLNLLQNRICRQGSSKNTGTNTQCRSSRRSMSTADSHGFILTGG